MAKQDFSDLSNHEFMERLYNDYKVLMLSTARRYVAGSTVDPEDAVQDSFEKLLKKVSEIRKKECCILPGYIVYIVRSTCIDLLRQRQRREGRNQPLDEGADLSTPSVEDLLELVERRGMLTAVWPSLSEVDRLLLEGKYIYGFSDGELAAQLGCGESSVRMKLTRARRRALQLLCKEKEG